ncbi:[FeFe] hydrogenase H-cluster radical SAM maturase HydE [bacterium]
MNISTLFTQSYFTKEDILNLLKIEDPNDQKKLFQTADNIRRKNFGNGVFLRGIIEFSNFCRNNCSYCGLNASNQKLPRYRLTKKQILDSVDLIYRANIKTIVLQSGEDNELNFHWLGMIISEIKSKYPDTAITLSVGEWGLKEYEYWRKCGADRYLLKMETMNPKLYEELHPNITFDHRMNCLKLLKELGYQVGSGNIVGLKVQTLDDIANDLLHFCDAQYDMLSISPFIPHHNTPLSKNSQVDPDIVLKIIAISRILSPKSHMPATTALGSMGKDYRRDGLRAGANVIMPNFTPMPYKQYYEIYNNKRCITEKQGECAFCMKKMVESVGRHIEDGRGDSILNEI